ncbi:hypothetical protein FS749_012319, partial [Ceratobasidium sp. UAMH 11750]
MARTGFKKTKLSTKPAAPKPVPQKSPSPPAAVAEPVQTTGTQADLSSSSEEDSEDDDGGVDEEGMTNLMRLLGEDGLDEVAEYQLSELGVDEAASRNEQDEDDDESEGQDEDESENASEEEEEAMAEGGEGSSDSGWIDEDGEMETLESSGAIGGEESSEDEDEDEGEQDEDDAVPLDEVSDVDEDA